MPHSIYDSVINHIWANSDPELRDLVAWTVDVAMLDIDMKKVPLGEEKWASCVLNV